jgi:tripartite-type tricarboxylate transporter receptor subunit TctC
MIEAGYADFVTSSWQGLFVPANTPRPVVARLHETMVKVLAIQDVKERFASGGVVASSSRTPEEFAAYVSAESERWGKVARESGATID